MKIEQLKNDYGNCEIKQLKGKSFVHVPGQRLGLICKKHGIKYLPAVVGFTNTYKDYWKPDIDGVVVHRNSVQKLKSLIESAEIKKRIAAEKKQKKAAELHAVQQTEMLKKLHEFNHQWAVNLPDSDLNTKIVFNLDEIGLDWATKEEWSSFGFEPYLGMTQILVEQGKATYFYRRGKKLEDESIPPEQLWERQLQLFSGDHELALADAIYNGNKLLKITGGDKSFYSFKDRWINDHQDKLVEGRISRNEIKYCWCMEAEENNDWCEKCGGTGIYSQSTLYEHHFMIGEQKYCFHSYTKPSSVSEAKGADLAYYGRRYKSLPPFRFKDYYAMCKQYYSLPATAMLEPIQPDATMGSQDLYGLSLAAI